MSNRQKSAKRNKSTIECGFGETCARPNCTFIHPETRNLQANIKTIEQKKHENMMHLQTRQMEMIMQLCSNYKACCRLDCPYRHPPLWNPVKNQQLAEAKRLQNEKRREQEQQHALTVYRDQHQSRNISQLNNRLNDDYDYDEDYFNVHEKFWQKQTKRQVDQW
ncbi:hypothetical protein I4U23_015420 [Adineta vaga]|nr:hypothetical protein I4U23_015420 [Adineta vaga]